MSQYLGQPELFDQIVRLGEEERSEPMRVIERFFADYRLHECREILWSMVETCITTDNSDFSEPEERADLMMRYAHIEELLEACFLLIGKGEGGADGEGAKGRSGSGGERPDEDDGGG